MFSVPSVVIQKKYECEESPENPEFVMHCKKFLLASVSCPGLPSFGFFQELQNTIACTGCQKPYFYLRKIEKKKESATSIGSDGDGDHDSHHHADSGCGCGSSQNDYFCPICYVHKFCNVHTFQNHDGSETHYIFKEKGSGGGILYQSSPIIERPSGSDSDSD